MGDGQPWFSPSCFFDGAVADDCREKKKTKKKNLKTAVSV